MTSAADANGELDDTGSESEVTATLETESQPEKPEQKCCFNVPGGPWPRNILLKASAEGFTDEKLVTLIVGPEEIHFTWFRDVLSFHSLFFANALKYDRYPEARDGKIKMPEDSADAVREFIRWITDHRLGGYGPGSENEDMTTEDYWHLLVEIYVFGHKYDVPRLQNVAIDRIISFFQDEAAYPRAETVEKMYEGTHDEDDPGRRIIVDLVCHSKMNIPAYLQDHQKCGGNHPDFCADVAKKLWDLATDERGYQRFRMDREDWNCVSCCDYHVSEVDSHFNGRKDVAEGTLLRNTAE